MDIDTLKEYYDKKKPMIKKRLRDFNNLSPQQQFHEFLFCTLTPQSNARCCWEAVQQIILLQKISKQKLVRILSKKTRFHNNKASYIIHNIQLWPEIQRNLNNSDRKTLRNFLAENVKGYGLKESGHFLRNIGKSNNQIAILDRHILRNLAGLGVISTDEINIKNKTHYFSIENKFISFSKDIKIPIDHLDLAFWSHETGEIFK